MNDFFSAFAFPFFFLRPWWLIAIIPLIVFIWLLKKRPYTQSNWQKYIDPHLLAHVLNSKTKGLKKSLLAPLVIFWLIVILILSGPSWQKSPPVTLKVDVPPLFLLLDLSRSMLTRDIHPDRLSVAKAKIRQLLRRMPPRPVTLIVYSAMAHQVIPITEDIHLIENLLEYIQPELMPAHGSNTSAALQLAATRLQQSTLKRADILMISDSVDQNTAEYTKQISSQGARVLVYAIASENGAYIPGTARGYLHINGHPIHTGLDRHSMQLVAESGQGIYQQVTQNDQDIENLLGILSAFQITSLKNLQKHKETSVWQDQAAWLLVLIIPFALFLFHPGLYGIVLIVGILVSNLLFSPLSYAQSDILTPDNTISFLWKNTNQNAFEALQNNRFEQAEQLFDDPLWRGIAQYRQRKYAQALNTFSHLNTAHGLYNYANTLVQLGRYQEALKSYQSAIQAQPNFKAARHNYQNLKKALEQAEKKTIQHEQIPSLNHQPKASQTKKKNVKNTVKPKTPIQEVAEDLLDSPTELDLKQHRDKRQLNLDKIGSQSGGAMLIHDTNKEKNQAQQGASVGQGMGEGSQELQKQAQLARKGQGQSESGQEADKIIANKSLPKLQNQPAKAGQKKTQTSTSKTIQNPDLVSSTKMQQDKVEPATRKKMQSPKQQKSKAKGGSGANTQLSQNTEQHQFLKHWLNSIDDNPSDLLKEIFKREYQNNKAKPELKPW